MRNLILILVLANVLYFLWGYFQGDKEQPPGVAILDEADLGPPLERPEPAVEELEEEPTESVAAAEESDGSGDDDAPDETAAETEPPEEEEGEIELTVALGRSCVTLGPFRTSDLADDAQSEYSSRGMQTDQRMEQGQIFVGHWVQIRGLPDRDAGNEAVAALRDGGIPEAYLVTTDDEGLKISLGVFGNRDGAERVQELARSLGYAAEITARTAEGMYYFVDVALPPGQGAGAMIDRYGEELVRMREVSSCPQ